MKNNNCNQELEALRFVQLMRNMPYHAGIESAPYPATLSRDIKVGLFAPSSTNNFIENVQTEEDLETTDN